MGRGKSAGQEPAWNCGSACRDAVPEAGLGQASAALAFAEAAPPYRGAVELPGVSPVAPPEWAAPFVFESACWVPESREWREARELRERREPRLTAPLVRAKVVLAAKVVVVLKEFVRGVEQAPVGGPAVPEPVLYAMADAAVRRLPLQAEDGWAPAWAGQVLPVRGRSHRL